MTSTARKFLWGSHLAVFGLGVMFGLRGFLDPKPQGPSPPGIAVPASSSSRSNPALELAAGEDSSAPAPVSTTDYAAAWDSLKGRFLPRQERLLIEKTLLEEWSIVDLAAAVRAVFAETTDQGPNGFGEVGLITLLECCCSGIQADPLKAWELVRSNSFGLETGRFRRVWLDCMARANPVLVFSILGELSKSEHFSTLARLAESSSTDDDPATRAAIWTHLSNLPDTSAGQEFLTHAGKAICLVTPPAELAAQILGELTPAGRKICISALALSLFEVVEDEDFPKPLFELPAEVRGEIAAASLKYGVGNEDRALSLANVALDSGNLDALQTASADPAFARFAKEMDQPLALVEWALRLPEDSRTLEIYHQSIEGAAHGDLEALGAKLQALPTGWQRDRGLAVFAKVREQRVGKQRRDEEE